MEVSSYQSPYLRDNLMCESARSFFSIKYSELVGSKYSYFLYGFKDEQDFEDFKQDLRDFQKLRNEFYGGVLYGSDDCEKWLDVKEELQFIRRPNDACKNRRRGHASRSGSNVHQKPAFHSKYGKRSLSKILVPASSEETSSEITKDLKGCQKRPQRTFVKERPDSSGLRVNTQRRSLLSEFDGNLAIRSSIKSFLMEFLNGDEHFQEFERVFETVNSRHNPADPDTNRRMSLDRDSGPRLSSDNEQNDNTPKSIQQSSSNFGSNIFADFFDNDETFLEFEKEFEKFRSSRRSNLLGSINSVGSSRDIFGDIKTYCERNIKPKSASLMSVNSCSSQDEATPSCGDDAVHPDLIWRSVEDWEKILRKMRRNSRLLLDTCCHSHNYQHGQSPLNGRSQDGLQSDAYQKTQSLADLRLCHGSGDLNQSPYRNPPSSNKWTQSSQSVSGLLRRSSVSSTQSHQATQPNRRSNSPSISVTLSDCDSSSGRWSETDDDDNRYSSSSTLCSNNGDTSYSFSCSCCSDLNDAEETDDDMTMDTVPSRTRSHSLMELPSQMRPNYLGLQATSADNLHTCDRYSMGGSRHLSSRLRDLSIRATDTSQHGDYDTPYLDDDTPTDDDGSIFSGGSPPSTVSAQLSDAESEHYHTASSDLSDHYSTAKSDLSNLLTKPGLESKCKSTDIDFSGVSGCPVADTPNRVLEWARQGHCTHDDLQPMPKERYHSYHGREGRPMHNYNWRHSGSACQYTCHQHCVPAVTLNCKSISEDGIGAAAARTPSPSDPRAHLETSLSIGKISTVPGCARIVPNLSNSTTNTVTSQAQRVSESVPNFQHMVQGRSGSLSGGSSIVHPDHHQENIGTSKAGHIPTHHLLSRSASEGFITVHSPPVSQPVLDLNPTPLSSQGQHISSPQSTPSYSNSRPGSLQRTHTQSLIKTALHNQELSSAGISDKATQGNSSATESTNNNILQLHNSSDNIASDLRDVDANQESTTEKDETDSGYRSGTIPDDKLPRVPSQDTLDRQELSRKIAKYNHFVPAASLEVTEKESFQGFVKVTMNLIRPITMELGARPPSIYELLTREHIVEENTQHVAFYMPRDTHKSLHITSDITTKEVVTSLLKKFHILDHPRKFAMYEQEFNDRNKLVRLRRLTDKDFPLRAILSWDPERIRNYRMVLQENETGEIVWDVFSLPELGNFLKVLDREEKETILELKHKYACMKQYIERRLIELRSERNKQC